MRLYLLEYGNIRHDWAPNGRLPVQGYLIRTDDGTNILVDTGFPAEAPPGMFELADGQGVLAQLTALDLTPADIHYVICTHLDPDHAGNNDLFTEAEFVIQRSHWDLAQADAVPRLRVAKQHWDQPHLKYRTVDGDTELVPGVELIEASGHILGPQSVLVRLPETGVVLLAIDTITQEKALDPDNRPMANYGLGPGAVRDSTRKLVDLA